MKRMLLLLFTMILGAAVLTSCVHLKPFTQEELDRLSYDGQAVNQPSGF